MAVVAVTGVFGGLAVRAQGAADAASLKTFDFMLGEVQYRILLPQRATLARRVGDRFQVSLSTRMLRQLEVSLAAGDGRKTYLRSQRLANGAVFTFEVLPAAEGNTGSGGPEESLEGHLQVGARTLLVKCHDQAEWPGSPDSTWCIDYLQHLTAVTGG